MAVTLSDVEHIARLARLRFDADELERMAANLNQILDYVEQLGELDTRDVEPLSHTSQLTNVMREDVVAPSLPVEEALRNAPDRHDGYFKVPRVIK